MAPSLLVTASVLAFLLAGCAARRPAVPPRDVLAESAALLRAGCYHCLQEGLSLVERRVDLPSRQRAFELALILTIRAKELGLPFEPWRTRAGALATGLAPSAAAGDFLSLADAIREDQAGLDRDRDFAQRRFGIADKVRPWLAAIESSTAVMEVRAYVGLAGACGYVPAEREASLAHVRSIAGGVPLLQYALGLCTSAELPSLDTALALEPRFVDASYPLGRSLLGPLAKQDAEPVLARARGAFPESAAIAYTEAMLFRDRRDWSRALDGFEATLRLVPTHHDARLGRVMAFSNLRRHDEAIAGATALIDEGTWLIGDAHYWRAWNQFNLDRLDESERDLARAKQLMRWSAVHVLSGLVQWRTQRPAVAEQEFVAAATMDADDCDAMTYLGGVRSELRKWLPAAEAFAGAKACREREAASLRATLDDLVARGAPEAAIASQRKSIAVSEERSAQMARNRAAMMEAALDAYRFRPTAYCPLPAA